MQNSRPAGFSLSTIAIQKHIGTLMLTLCAIVLGVFFLFNLQVDLLPTITYPSIGVRVNAPGISPDVAVDEVTRPLEEALARTEGVIQVYSQTREGQVSLDLFFQPGGNIDQALNDATAAFNRARNTLPDTIEEPRLFKRDPSQLPVYEFALTSDALPGQQLRVFADQDLSRELSVIPGVAAVDVSGGAQEEVRVLIDLARLQALGVGLTDVLTALEQRNQDISGGRILGNSSEPLTRTVGRFRTAKEIEDLSFEVNQPSGENTQANNSNSANSQNDVLPPQRVYLRDFAQVIDGTEEQRVFVSLNGKPAVKVSVQKQPEANTIAVVEGVKKRLEELQRQNLIPPDLQVIPVLDESRFIQNAIANVTSSGLAGAALAAIAVLLFLGSLRQTFIIVLAIPLASLMAIGLMKLFNFSLNVFSLGGLALGVGIVVDNSIVMLENIAAGAGMTPGAAQRRTMSSSEVIDQAEASSQEVESALVASTATNLVAILPFLLIGGLIALLFNELILTISFAVAASLLVALTVVPALSSRLLAVPFSSRLSEFWLLQQFNDRFTAVTGSYQRWLARVLQWRWGVVAIAVLVLGGSSWFLVGQIPQELLPQINTGQANLIALFPPGTPLTTNQKVMAAVDDILQSQPETQAVFTTTGGFLFATTTSANPLRSSSTVILKPGSDLDGYISRVNQQIQKLNLVGIRIRLSPGRVRGIILTNSPLRSADVDVILRGSQAQLLNQTGREVLQTLDDKVTLASFRPDADARQPEVQIRPDWERVAQLGLSAQEIGETIQTAIEGFIATQLQRGERLVDVRVQLNREDITRPDQLQQLPLFTENNQAIRLGDIAQIELGRAPGEIQRINQQQVFLIAGNLNEGARLSDALQQVQQVLAQVKLPPGITLLPSAAAEANQQLQRSLQILGGLATFLVFVVMAVQYNSLIDPLVIMLTVPLALAGGIWGLYLTQTAIGATVIVGAILLVGIVVNNAIIMVELANQLQEKLNCDRTTAILKAAPQRLRPILMTTITTVLGMFPLALGLGEGSEFLQPLGIVVFSGLSLATVLTLFIIPCFYVILHRLFEPKSSRASRPSL